VEAAVIIDASRDPVASRRFDDLIKEAQIIIEPVTEPQARTARDAYRDFGEGSSHPAKLNFGDCFAYGLAKFTDEPLLFKGEDFAHTDIRPAAIVMNALLLVVGLTKPKCSIFSVDGGANDRCHRARPIASRLPLKGLLPQHSGRPNRGDKRKLCRSTS
jgi:uncharacterized protein with PIN domain